MYCELWKFITNHRLVQIEWDKVHWKALREPDVILQSTPTMCHCKDDLNSLAQIGHSNGSLKKGSCIHKGSQQRHHAAHPQLCP